MPSSKKKFLCSFLVGCVLALLVGAGIRSVVYAQAPEPAAAAALNDPTGATTGTAKDVTVKDAANPTLPEVMDTVGHNKIAINFVWTLVAGFLVMFMQAGFAMVETGLHPREERRAHHDDELHGVRRSACSGTGSAASRCTWAASARWRRSAARRRSTTSSPSTSSATRSASSARRASS